MSLASFSVKNSILSNMITLFVLIGGIMMIMTLQRDTFPQIELDLVLVRTVYQGATPEEVENLITNPIEDELRDLDGIEEMNSRSIEGLSVVTIQLDSEYRFKERVINDIQRRVDRVDSLPDESEDPVVEAVTADDPVLRVTIGGDVSESVLRDVGDELKTRLEGILGVSTVDKNGWRDKEFWVEVNLDTLNRLELTLGDVVQALADRNINRPGGKLQGSAGGEVLLRTMGQFYSVDEIEDVIIRSNIDGNHVKVRDIGTVKRSFEEDTLYVRVNGRRAVTLDVKKKRSGDTLDVAQGVKSLLDEVKPQMPPGVELGYVDDTSMYVERRLNVLSSNGIIGFILVVLILFLFMNFKIAVVTGIGIPFAFLSALMIMSLFGITINLITMFGLIIVLGMVVDDAIIVGENIFRHLENGVPPKKAAMMGADEVMYPVISTVLTTIAAFAPLVFAPDVMGQVLRWFPITVTITLLASLFEVLFIMPCHAADLVRKSPVADGKRHKPMADGIMTLMMRIYDRLIQLALRGRYVFLVITVAVFSAMGFLVKNTMRVDIFPADLIDVFTIRATYDKNYSLAKTADEVSKLESLVEQLPDSELEDIVSYVGGHFSPSTQGVQRGANYASMLVYLKPQNKRDRLTQTIIDDLRDRTASLSELEKIEFQMIEPGPPTGKPLEVKIRGKEFNLLLGIGDEIISFLEKYGGVTDIQTDYEAGKQELRVVVDYEEASRLGLSLEQVSRAVYAGFQGAEATVVREGNDEVAVRVWLDEKSRDTERSLDHLFIRNHLGRRIALGRVASFEPEEGLPSIYHYDGDRVLTVSAFFEEGTNSVEVNRALEKEFKDLSVRYPGYDLIRGGEWKETRKLMFFMFRAFAIAMMLIYIILAVQFKSFFQPFVVMVSIPLGLIGVILALVAHDQPVSIMATMGMVGLTGVVVNDAIVLVKFINDQRRNHKAPLFDALVEAGRQRLRPILLTSITTVVGLLPVIYGWGGYEPFVAPAAITLAYGLVVATFLTLLVVPAVYHVLCDIKSGLCRLMGIEPAK